MIICPYCDTENIEGVDACEHCGQSLSGLDLPSPATHVERCLLRDRLSTVAPRGPLAAVTPTTTVREVVQLMAERSIGCVLVIQDAELVGIFSEHDVLMKLGAEFPALSAQPVGEFMTSKPQTLDARAKIAFALHRMGVGRYRHVPIVDEHGVPRQMISVRDVLQYLTHKLAEADD
jgi:CBS domain-containing protein